VLQRSGSLPRRYPIARIWRDARVQRIYGGTTEIMEEVVSRDLQL
jgi:alkylation response protein AidB-like acyl-CoA dehydrogenase